jgi:hypothetical protein
VTTQDDLERWDEASLASPARLADQFARRESREQMAKLLRDPVALFERTNGWQVAEAAGDATPDRRQAFGCEPFGDPEGIGSLGIPSRDPIGVLSDGVPETRLDGEPLKKGVASVGVPRQDCGTPASRESPDRRPLGIPVGTRSNGTPRWTFMRPCRWQPRLLSPRDSRPPAARSVLVRPPSSRG